MRAYGAAVVIIAVIMAGVFWAVGGEPLRGSQVAEGTRFEATPIGADGALRPCVVCHSIESSGPMRVAPPLHGIVGAKKARATWFAYSAALQKAGGVWTEADLDKFLASPSKFLPGTSKTIIGYPDPKQRADIIAALKTAP
jgi:cytochrome c